MYEFNLIQLIIIPRIGKVPGIRKLKIRAQNLQNLCLLSYHRESSLCIWMQEGKLVEFSVVVVKHRKLHEK